MCQKVRFMRLLSDLGAGSIIGFGVISLVLGIMTLSLGVSAQSLAIARLQTQTDNAALAAEDVLRGLAIGYPCETAEQIVKGFGGTLDSCHIVNLDIYISVYQQLMGIVHRVKAHAGVGLDSAR